MAGGTYHDHTDIEIALGYGAAGLTSSSEPLTDGQVDAISIVTEGTADGYIRSRSRYTLANANSNNALATTACLVAISMEFCKVMLGYRSGMTTRATRGGGTESFWDRQDIKVFLQSLLGLATSGSTVASYGHAVQSGKTHLGT